MQRSRGDESDDFTNNPFSDDFYLMLRQGRSFSGEERNCCFLNTFAHKNGGDRFANISAVSGIDFPEDGRALAHVDWDRDGDLDLWISNRNAPRLRLLINDHPRENRFVAFQLNGNGEDTNRQAVGARVTVYLRPTGNAGSSHLPRQMMRTVYAGDGFLSQGTSWLHFGLGRDGEIDKVEVRWPNRDHQVEEFTGVTINGRFSLVQGSGTARELQSEPQDQSALRFTQLELPPKDEKHRIPLVFQLPAPPVSYIGLDGQRRELLPDSGKVTLVNLWSSTCRPCLAELGEFAKRADELEQAGLRILAVSIDAITGDVEEPVQASQAVVERLGLHPFYTGMADPQMLEQLRRLHNILIKLESPLPLPTSFLIDRDGNLDVIYKGAVDVATLLEDAAWSDASLLARFERAAAFPGSVIDDPVIVGPMVMEGGIAHLKLARELAAAGKDEAALAEYRRSLESLPDSGVAHNDYGVMLKLNGDIDQAIEHFTTATELDPVRPQFRINLAQVLAMKQRYPSAIEQLEAVIDESPGHSDAYFNLGLVKVQSGDVTGARRSFEKAIECNPQHDRAHFGLGNLLLKQGKTTEARLSYQRALDIVPGEGVLMLNIAQSWFQERNMSEAERWCNMALEARPDLADGHYLLGVIYLSQRRDLEARQRFEAAIQFNPGHQGARAALRRPR
ncbi:MAG: tetratricopeptide repeat protein [Pirellulaceae bacterium]